MSDLIFRNAHVITMNPRMPYAEVVAIEKGRITSVTTNEKLNSIRTRKSRIIDCHGRTVLPGLIDAHLHLNAFAERCVSLNLSWTLGFNSIADIQCAIKRQAKTAPPGTWIRGKGYDEFHLTEKRHPTRWDLDKVAPDNPVKITHRSSHAHVLNTQALSLVGVSMETGDPPDGLIDRDLATGEPTGLLYEMGAFLSERIPPIGHHDLLRGLCTANKKLISSGITSIQDASYLNDLDKIKTIASWKNDGLFTPRIKGMLGQKGFGQLEGTDSPDFLSLILKDQFDIGGIKVILDETTGELHPSQMELNKMVLKFHRAGLQVAIHAIEENAVESACNAIAYALERVPREDHRHRIEHCALCGPCLTQRIASLGITVVTQPSFLYYHGDRYLEQLPSEDLPHLYAIKSLMDAGIPVAGSSDCPIVPPHPLIGIYAAITRKSLAGKTVGPAERITPGDALKMYTVHAAGATFEENMKGAIAVGKLADIIVLDGNLMKTPVTGIKDLAVEMTILDGEIVWCKSG